MARKPQQDQEVTAPEQDLPAEPAGAADPGGTAADWSTTSPPADVMQIGDDLFIRWVDVTSLREQDINAQVMQPRHFERLTGNIRRRGMVESLPYCHQPGGTGPIEVISGHHRSRAARAAGLQRIPAIIDTRTMRRSEVIAKQIAHNELHGNPDKDVLAQLVAMIDNVDDLIATGLDETQLPTVEPDDTKLAIPHGEFDWRAATLMFLPHQMDDFKAAVTAIANGTDLVGVAPVEQFEEFASAVYAFGRCKDVRNFTTMIALLTDLARREVEQAEHEAAQQPDDQPAT
ncbi:ParB/Srx family N-terminal domain-containing protein [Streptomyces sp. HPF1205]|uniref:ParB/Srx family N-terminal domain-containing protein n=1 Tax=Streptomyces sp. HPF1205 TaxID=2873262 RepID=UPI001CEDE14A|nr:ParB/Srx family N-terminal domain-containing protein [Streptomyces sp. HPF1205]